MLEWPFFEDRHREFAACAAEHLPEVAEDGPRRALPRLRARARGDGWLRARGRRAARRAHALPRARDARLPRRARRLRVRDAGARRRADLAVRRRRAARALPAGGRRRREDRGVRALRARRRLRRRGDDDDRARAAGSPASRPGSPTAGSPTSTPSSRARAEGISAFVVDAEHVEVAERIDVIAPHPLATLRFDDAPGRAARPAGQGDADRARARSTSSARRSAPRRSGFARRALDEALARVRERELFGGADGRAAARAGQARRHGARRSTPARCSSTARRGRRTSRGGRVTREAAMAKLHATETAQRVDRRRRPALRRRSA